MPPQVATPVALLDLSGGLVEGAAGSALQPNQLKELENFYPFGAKLVRRWGIRRLTAVEYDERIATLFPLKRSTGEWLLLAGAETGFAKMVGGVFAQLPVGDGPRYTASTTERWRVRQRLDVAYAVRKDTGSLKRITPDWMLAAGIDAPSVAPELADGGAGAAEAGAYKGVVVFKNRTTKCRSNPSPVSVALTIGANGARAWSKIATSPNAQVDARELCVSLPDNDGEYFVVDEIPDNTTDTWTEGHSIDDFGDPCSFSLGLPPPNVSLIELWRERMWLSDRRDVFFSGVAQPEGYDELDLIQVYPDDGHEIRCLHADGSRLIVGKSNAMHLITAAGEGRFAVSTLSDRHGIVAPDSIKGAEGFVFWYSPDNNVYRAVGSQVESISTIAVRETLDAVPAAQRPFASGAVWPERSLYLLDVGFGSPGYNRVVLAYNYKTGSWARFVGGPGILNAVSGLYTVPDEDFIENIYATAYDGHAYEYNSPGQLDDAGEPFICKIRVKDHSQGGPKSGLTFVSFLCSDVDETATLEALGAGGVTIKQRDDIDLSGSEKDWKEYAFRTQDRLQSEVGVRFTYSGRSHLEIMGIGLGLTDSKRRPMRR